jgi:hypothetical protein
MSVELMYRFGVALAAVCDAALVCAMGRRSSVINAARDARAQIAFLGRVMHYRTLPRR